MSKFILSGFGDEIHSALDTQMDVMQSLDIHYIETRGIDGKNINDFTPQQAKAVKARMDARGFGVSALGSPIGKISIEDAFEPHLDQFKNLVEVAHAIGTRAIRLFSFFIPQGKDPHGYRDEVMERMAGFVAANKGSGVTLLHENEKFIYGDTPQRCLEIFKAFDGEISCTYDPSNFVQCNVDNKAAFEMLAPYIRYMHIKDSVYTSDEKLLDKGFDTVSDAHRPAGLGDGNVQWILSQLVQRNYEGFVSVEPHLSQNHNVPGSGADKFIVAANALKKLIANVM